ncbi:MAG: ROK family protein [Verrucomicrobiota bacterium]
MKTLVIDIGGTTVKIIATGVDASRKIVSGREMTPEKMVTEVKAAAADWDYERVSIGYPGPVIDGKPAYEPRNLGRGWVGFDFAKAFGYPVKIINDAALQALGSYSGGRMLFMGIGTGLGTALVIEGIVQPTELAHLPYKNNGSFEDYVGKLALEKHGQEEWSKDVRKAIELLKAATQTEYVVLGGGNARLVKDLPEGTIIGSNDNAFKGGFRLWDN